MAEVATNTGTRVKGMRTRGGHVPGMWEEDAVVPSLRGVSLNFEVHVDLPPTLR